MQKSGYNKNHGRNKKKHFNNNSNRNRNQQNQQGRNHQGRTQNGDASSSKNSQQGNNKAPLNYGRVVESHVPKQYGIVFYDTFAQARADLATIAEKAKACDQLNIVIKAEGDMNDPELKAFGMVFAGAAWHLIHTRRVEDSWYDEPR